MLAAGSLPAQAAPSLQPTGDGTNKIQPELLEKFETTSTTGYWIRFTAEADLSQAREIDDWVERGEAVAAALRETAEQSQAAVRSTLDAQGVSYQPFWVTNAIYVPSGQLTLAQNLASRAEVEGIYAPVEYELIRPDMTQLEHVINAVEWGVANINADDAWAEFGARGAGIVIANIDTGVQWDHPALVNQYRGNLGDGNVDHNYSWFNAAGICGDAPCDLDGHGTHTMGTMVGDDGGDNQIGVAPEATWIAANGCCPSDAALIASGEWMLEPTDLAGQNPDASKRPHIINNSWGSRFPSNDPFMEDVLEAWDASGILGIWANGNSGELGCGSSGSPGSRILNYSVGAYDINNEIADFSGRGPGQDGEIKPNISAPGVAVRSSLPGNAYGLGDGTSMAAPHVSGAVALLWSAAPSLIGETDATKALLDDTAIDTEDLQCGGTADDNNVYGEGRLDALALLQNAPIGDSGTLAGTVTDAAGDPIAGATVTIDGDQGRSLTTGSDGTYSTVLTAGDYSVTASAFGFDPESAEVTVAVNETTTQDFELTEAPSVTISGLVRDDSGHGWPLYAKVTAEGTPLSTYTNPYTGRYRLTVPANATYALNVEPQYPGYLPVSEEVEVGSSNLVRDLAVAIDAEQCIAPGYGFSASGVGEDFESGTTPEGWTVVDNVGNGQVWRFDNPNNRTNNTGGSGGFAIVDSDFYGSGNSQDTDLVTPLLDLTGVTEPVIRFNQDFNWWSGGDDESANVDLSIDGGATWETVLSQSGADVLGPREEVIEIPQAANEPDVQVRFHYGPAAFDFWWMIDNVRIGECSPFDGGLVAGHVTDANTGAGINGARITSDDTPDETTQTAATPDDSGLADGFYWMFSSITGEHPFTASAGNYVADTADVDVESDWVTRADFELAAGQLTVEPATIEADVPLGASRQRTLTITNSGDAPVEVELTERDGSFEILRADDSRLTEQGILASQGAPVQQVPVNAPLERLAGAFVPQSGLRTSTPVTSQVPHEEPWLDLPNYPGTIFDNNVVMVDGLVYSFGGVLNQAASRAVFVFDPAAQSWTRLDDMPGPARMQAAEGVIDGLVYLVSGWSDLDTTTMIYDPATGEWSTGANAPAGRAAPGSAVVNGQLYMVGGCTTDSCAPYSADVFRYDPASDSWETLADYPAPTAWLSCASVDNELYCAGGLTAAGATTDAYRYDEASDSWEPVADMPFPLWGSAYVGANGQFLISTGITAGDAITNQGLAYDPATDAWEQLPAANNALFRSGGACGLYKVGGSDFDPFFGFIPDDAVEVLPGFEQCGGAADVPWLTVNPTTATLEPGDSLTVTVRLTAEVAQPGTYTAGIRITEDTPYSVNPVDVTMNVTPPATWGKLMGTVEAIDCDGDRAPLADATVHLSTWTMEHTLYTDADGNYAHWLDHRHSPFNIIVAKDGYQPQVRESEVVAGEVTVEDWALRRVCAATSNGEQQPL